jgi:hypothetical protein
VSRVFAFDARRLNACCLFHSIHSDPWFDIVEPAELELTLADGTRGDAAAELRRLAQVVTASDRPRTHHHHGDRPCPTCPP